VRASLTAKTYEEACELSLRAHGKSLSRQAFELIPKIREVDDLLTPELQVSIFEVHPEVSFWALNGRRPLRHKKYESEGRAERLRLLLPHFPAIQEHLAELDRRKSGQHDLLDAAAAAWTADCVAKRVVARQFDERGLRMEIVY
jgi:predicted RNase H-like nuclease